MQVLRGVLALAPVGIAALVYDGLAGMDWAGVFELRAFVWAVALAAVLHAGVFLPDPLSPAHRVSPPGASSPPAVRRC
jgi:Na+/H+-dicarboxylate symporter